MAESTCCRLPPWAFHSTKLVYFRPMLLLPTILLDNWLQTSWQDSRNAMPSLAKLILLVRPLTESMSLPWIIAWFAGKLAPTSMLNGRASDTQALATRPARLVATRRVYSSEDREIQLQFCWTHSAHIGANLPIVISAKITIQHKSNSVRLIYQLEQNSLPIWIEQF